VCGFAFNTFACGPSFPNNLLDDGDHAVLQAPIRENFELELARMKIKTGRTSERCRQPMGQSYPDQSTARQVYGRSRRGAQ